MARSPIVSARPRCARAAVLAMAMFIGLPALAATATEDYRLPPKDIVDLLDAPRTPRVSIDPTGEVMLLIESPDMPFIRDLAQPMLRVAGYRINPKTNGPFRTIYNTGLTLQRIDDGSTIEVEVPRPARLGTPAWAPDGRRFAVTNTTDDGIELWVGKASTGTLRRVLGPMVNEVGGASFEWMPEGVELICRVVDKERGPTPEPPAEPAGPVVQENDGRVSPVRTYQDLLKSPHDEAVFEHVMMSRLLRVHVESGATDEIGGPAMYTSFDPSPNGDYLLVSRIERPFSYLVTARSFPTVYEVWTPGGTVTRRVAELPLRDTTPIGGVAVGPRRLQWMPVIDSARVLWAEALDDGDPKNEVPHRDRMMMLDKPFDGEPVEFGRTEHRVMGLTWLEMSSFCLVSEYDRDRRWTRTWLMSPGAPDHEPALIWDRSVNDRYGDPGRPLMRTNRGGKRVALTSSNRILLSGRGATPEGDRPFLDRFHLDSRVTERMWLCDEGVYETVIDRVPEGLITRRESPTDPPNYFLSADEGGAIRQLTHFPDPAPQLRDIHRELVTYERDDGVTLSATLYLPADYEAGTRLPLIVWAYPREFNDPKTAGQVSGSPYRFTTIRGTSHLFLLTQGYAIMDGATMPVIGDPETMNDAFIDQIVSSAKAAIDKAAEMGVADPDRVGVGGHSYGAFMTGNLLAHSDLFRAGVARSGAYNRTLTPFGFQSERRTLWEAPESYFAISPFMHAHKINEPILLVHGQMDNNAGTYPLQSERMYHALKGHGATVRLVMLPYESHGYRARESVLHVLAEMVEWFDEHVKYKGEGRH